MTGHVPLEALNVGWSVNGRAIVSDVSISLRGGEMMGLIGPNGSGKSTLLKMLAGLARPKTGEVRLFGQPMARLRRLQIAQHLAFVAQQAETSDRILVRDAVELGRTPWLSAFRPWGAEDDAIVSRALDAVDMQGFAQREWSSLSGGERQRVHIARAYAQTPQILLLDEPTNHLDIHHQLGILDMIEALPLTTVIALHDLQHALRCDRLAVLKEGRCVALGTPSEILTPALIRETFNVNAELIPHPAGGQPVFAFQSYS